MSARHTPAHGHGHPDAPPAALRGDAGMLTWGAGQRLLLAAALMAALWLAVAWALA